MLSTWKVDPATVLEVAVEHEVQRAGGNLAAIALSGPNRSAPVDRFGEYGGTFGDSRHRVDVGRGGEAEFESDFVAQRLVLTGAPDEHDPFDVLRRKSGLLDRLSGRCDGIGDLVGDQLVQLGAIDRAGDIHLLARRILGAEVFCLDHCFVAARKLDFGSFRREFDDAADGLEVLFGRKIVWQVEIFDEPAHGDVVNEQSVEVSSAAHGNAALAEQADPAADALGNRDVERAAADVVDEEYAVAAALLHYAHDGGHRLLHQGGLADAGGRGGLKRRIFLHLVEGGRDCDDRGDFRVVAKFLWQVAE